MTEHVENDDDKQQEAAAIFPWRRFYMPPFLDMFERLKEFRPASHPDYLGLIQRSQDDMIGCDTLTDHYVEDVRIHARQRGVKSLWTLWVEKGEEVVADRVYEQRSSLGYGCSLFSTPLGVAV